LGRKWYGNVKEAKKIHSYVKYETNSATKRKAIWSQKLDFYLQTLAKWSLEKQQVVGVSLLQTIEFYTKTQNASNKHDLIRRKKEISLNESGGNLDSDKEVWCPCNEF